MVTRRNFLGLMLGAAAAPVIVRSESLMKIFVPPQKKIITGMGLICDFDEVSSFYPKSVSAYNMSTDFAEAVMNNNQALIDHIGENKLLVTPRYHEDEMKIDLIALIKKTKERQAIVANQFVDEMIKQYSFFKA